MVGLFYIISLGCGAAWPFSFTCLYFSDDDGRPPPGCVFRVTSLYKQPQMNNGGIFVISLRLMLWLRCISVGVVVVLPGSFLPHTTPSNFLRSHVSRIYVLPHLPHTHTHVVRYVFFVEQLTGVTGDGWKKHVTFGEMEVSFFLAHIIFTIAGRMLPNLFNFWPIYCTCDLGAIM